MKRESMGKTWVEHAIVRWEDANGIHYDEECTDRDYSEASVKEFVTHPQETLERVGQRVELEPGDELVAVVYTELEGWRLPDDWTVRRTGRTMQVTLLDPDKSYV